MTRYDEERLAGLLRTLRPAPSGWVRAAQQLPAARAVADLERALRTAGVEPRRNVVDHLRRRLDA